MAYFNRRKARKETLRKIQNAENRIDNNLALRTALYVPTEDTSIFIVASSPVMGSQAAKISDRALEILKSIVIEDLIRSERKERTILEAERTSYQLLTKKARK